MSAVLGALTLLAGCGGTPAGTFIIVHNQVPDSNCVIPGTLSALYRPEGLLDLRQTTGYVLFPLLENDFPGTTAGSDVDGNRIALSGFDVDVDVAPNPEPGPITDLIQSLRALPDGDPMKSWVQYSRVTSGSVASGGGDTPDDVLIFPPDLGKAIRDMNVLSTKPAYVAMVHVRARGATLGLGNVRSDVFNYPLWLCDGCLMSTVGDCPIATGIAAGNVCDPGQDEVTTCCTNSGSYVCPAVVSSK